MKIGQAITLRLLVACFTIAWSAGTAFSAACTSFNLGTNGSLTLTDDYTQTVSNTPCLVISGTNATIDINGHLITSTGVNGSGIKCTSPGMIVTDSSPTPAGVTGSFFNAIENCQILRNVRVFGSGDGVPTNAIGNDSTLPLKELTNSHIIGEDGTGQGGWGFVGYLADTQATIANNLFEVLLGGIWIYDMVTESGLGLARIENNVIDGGYFQLIVEDTVKLNLENNLLINRDPDLGECTQLEAGVPYSRLYCDCDECDSAEHLYDFPDYPVANLSNCPGTLSSGDYDGSFTYVLHSNLDLDATSGACITVAHAGRKVDLNGFTIHNSSSGGTGISFTAGGGEVLDSGTTKGGISGDFATAISEVDTVTNLRIGNGPDVGISSSSSKPLDVLTGNSIDVDTTAVSAYLKNRPDSVIQDNYLRGGLKGLDILGIVDTSGTAKPPVAENVIRDSHQAAIQVNSAHLNVHDNVMYRRDPAAIAPTTSNCLSFLATPTFNDLLCDCPSSATHDCEGDAAPISVPRL